MSTRATQPYRATGARRESTASRMMQMGRPALMSHSSTNMRRKASKRKRRRKGRARYSSPLHRVLQARRALNRG